MMSMLSLPGAVTQDAPGRVSEPISGGVGDSAGRPDGTLKVTGEFAFSSDLWSDDMLWGATLRSPHPRARIRGVDVGRALKLSGVYAVLTHEDVPGRKYYGLEVVDQPVLAMDEVRYAGEPVAVVAADHPETARRAVAAIRVDYEELPPIVDSEAALRPDSELVFADRPGAPAPGTNVTRHVAVRTGHERATAEVVVAGDYEVGMQDQAFLGPESGLAVPAEDGGVDIYVATQWLHVDRGQIAPCLGLPEDKVRIGLAGVGGAFGAREDLSMQIHAAMLALRAGKPVKMVYSREESFFGHVHRHPARLHYEHGATRDGQLVYVGARIVLDGGAYTSSSPAVCANAATLGIGPYRVPNVVLDAYITYTNNPPCGAMRGFGAVQACFGYESQMDRIAAALDMDPVDLRIKNALAEGDRMPTTGQLIDSAAPVAELLHRVRSKPLPPPPSADRGREVNLVEMPGGVSNTTHGEGVRRGVGYGIGIKNVGFSEGFDDYSTARVRLSIVGGEPTVMVHTAAAEVGQGLIAVQAQIARTELGIDRVVVHPADTSVGSAGSSSASRQTYVTGGAVRAACEAVRIRVLKLAAERLGSAYKGSSSERDDPLLEPSRSISVGGDPLLEPPSDLRGLDLVALLRDEAIEEMVQWRHRPTTPIDPETGRGDAHVQFAFAAHRAVVDVDTELGLVRVVQIDTAQDVGKAINPRAVLGQIHGGTAQGLGLALMEEIQVAEGRLRNPSFTDYLIPTILDMPPMQVDMLELADPHAPYGLRGVGEPPTISSTPAIVAAIRDATGRPLARIPVRPDDIVSFD